MKTKPEHLIERALTGRRPTPRPTVTTVRATLEDEGRQLVEGNPQFEKVHDALNTILRHTHPVLDAVAKLESERADYTDEAFDRRMADLRERLTEAPGDPTARL